MTRDREATDTVVELTRSQEFHSDVLDLHVLHGSGQRHALLQRAGNDGVPSALRVSTHAIHRLLDGKAAEARDVYVGPPLELQAGQLDSIDAPALWTRSVPWEKTRHV